MTFLVLDDSDESSFASPSLTRFDAWKSKRLDVKKQRKRKTKWSWECRNILLLLSPCRARFCGLFVGADLPDAMVAICYKHGVKKWALVLSPYLRQVACLTWMSRSNSRVCCCSGAVKWHFGGSFCLSKKWCSNVAPSPPLEKWQLGFRMHQQSTNQSIY